MNAAEKQVAELKALVTKTLDDNKATDIVSIDLQGKSTIADYMIIATGGSSRQVAALAQRIMEETKKAFPKNRQHVEGLAEADWVLVDLDDIIVHIFRPDVRQFYSLEKMWSLANVPAVEQRVMMSTKNKS